MKLKINKLRGRMGELNINLTKLESLTGISRKSLKFIINGDRKPRDTTVKKICEALKIAEDKILYYFPHYVPVLSTNKDEEAIDDA